VATVLPFVPPVPVVIIAQGGLRGIITGWLIGAIQDTVTLTYVIGRGLSFSNVTTLMGGVLLQGDLDAYAALRLFDEIICDYAYRLGHWEAGAAWQLTIPITAGAGAGAAAGVGPITWGPMPIGDIVTAIEPPPEGLQCLGWDEIKQRLCDLGILPDFLCEEETEAQRNVLAVAICKCVGDTACGAGIYYKCFTVGAKTCKNRGEMQRLADHCFRHTDFRCPVTEADCVHGHCNVGAAATATPVPVTITGDTELWWVDRAAPAGYPVQQSLAATAPVAGKFVWTIPSGGAFANFSGSLTRRGPRALLTSRAPSGAVDDGEVKVEFTGDAGEHGEDRRRFTVFAPDDLGHLGDTDAVDPTFAYVSFIGYDIRDQFGTVLPRQIGINEQFTAQPVADFPGMDWRRGAPGAELVSPASWADKIQGETSTHTPTPLAPGSAGAGVAVYHWPGVWRAGSRRIGGGREVKRVTWQKFRGFARHT
jgi:hypothetical protein